MDLQEMQLKNGSVLVSITGYCGETDFYAMYDIIKEISPINAAKLKGFATK